MTIAICNYVSFSGGYYFQNFFAGETKSYAGQSHIFAPFGVTSGAATKGGDRSDAAIVAPNYPISANLFVQACQERWSCTIKTVLLDPETYAEVQLITSETWMCSRAELSVERAVLRLSSPLDAVDAQVPKRVLNSSLVGSVPATGQIST